MTQAFNTTVSLLYDAASMVPEIFLAALQRYVNSISWLAELTLQGLQDTYRQAQQMQLRLQRTMASEVEISDCRSAYSTCIQMAPSRPSPQVDGLRHSISYHRPSGQRLYTEEALEINPISNITKTVGRLTLFGPTLCRFEDGSSNVAEQTGVYADRPLEATSYTEACPFPNPRVASIIDGAGLSATQGCVTGLSRVAETYMCQQGYDASTSYYVTGFARFVLTGLIVAITHYAEASARDEESPLASAVIMAFLSIVQMLVMMGIGMLLTSSTRYAGERARDAGWTRTGNAIETIGTYVAPALPYVDCIRQHGIVNTMLCAVTGRGAQAGTEFIGHHLLGRR